MVNIVGVRTLVPPTVGGPPLTEAKMTARAILQCRPNSHPFPERTLVLDQPVKIGRSVARARPATNNAIFDCKVLSRTTHSFGMRMASFTCRTLKAAMALSSTTSASARALKSLRRGRCAQGTLCSSVSMLWKTQGK